MLLWLRQLAALTVKEFLTIVGDPKSRFVVIGPPILQFFVFGYAATYDVKDVPYAFVDDDRSAESRDLLARFQGSENFSLVGELAGDQEIADQIDLQRVRLVLRVGQRFAESLRSGEPAPLQVLLDGRNSNVSGIVLGYIDEIVERWNAEHAFPGQGPGIELVTRAWFNPNLESRWFIVSALPAEISLVVVMILTSLSVAREREQGTFDQTLVAPLSSTQVLIGKSLPAFLFGLGDALLLSVVAMLWFGVPLQGSLAALVGVLSIFILAVCGVGLFLSSLATTMQQGLLGAFLFIMPAVILSGFTTPIENMPVWLQEVTRANPARYAVSACREIFLEGARLPDVAHHMHPLALIALVTLASAAWLFRHRAQ